MDAAAIFRIMSLIPERSAWSPSGSTFGANAQSERVVALARLLHWLSPLEVLTTEHQQLLGIRTGGGRPADEDSEPEEGEDSALHNPGAGTQLAA